MSQLLPEISFPSFPSVIFEIFRMSLTDFELLAESQFDRYRDALKRREYFHSKARPRLPISGLSTCFD
jgi:hypothetical protein